VTGVNRGITVVCGGGGVWGTAWMTGIVMGLAEKRLDIRSADRFIGTSAGSVVSAQLTSARSTAALFERQIDPAKQAVEFAPPPEMLRTMTELMMRPWASDQARLRAICDLAQNTQTMSVEERRRNVVERVGLGEAPWPEKPVLITAIDTETLELVAFAADSGVSLIDAVGASTAVPGVYPPRPIGDRSYIDGGLWRTAENAHLAEGAKAVLILAPMGRMATSGLGASAGLTADIARLEAQGSKVVLIAADEAALATMAPSPLDPVTRRPAVEAGRQQGRREFAAAHSLFDRART
jgi:NTE family protein